MPYRKDGRWRDEEGSGIKGRPPGAWGIAKLVADAEDARNPPDPPDFALFVEGRVRVLGGDAEAFEAVGKLRPIAEGLGLVVHTIDVESDNLESLRKTWGSGRVDLDHAAAWIADYPGATFQSFAEKLFLGPYPLNEVTFEAAKAKARVALSRLHKMSRVKKTKNVYGQICLWPAGPPTSRPRKIPAEILLAVEAGIDAAINKFHRAGKTVSTRAVALAVADLVWNKRDGWEEQADRTKIEIDINPENKG